MGRRHRVLVIGIDGATFDIIKPLMEEGKLPHFKKLTAKGSSCELKSTIPMLSPVAWTTFATGGRPGKHGIFNFLARQDGTYEIIPSSSSQRRLKPIWKVAGEQGRKVVVMNVPATFPPDPVNGLMIAGDPAPFHDQRRVFPHEAYQGLEQTFGKNFLKPAPPGGGESRFLHNLLGSVERWTSLAKHALQSTDWDLGVVVYIATDTAQHFFWKNIDTCHPLYTEKEAGRFGTAISQVYQKMDWAMGELLKLTDGNTGIVILSDHGFGPLYRAVPLMDWLVERGYLSFRNNGKREKRGTVSGLARLLLSRLGLMEGLPPISTLSNVDWARTKAYFLGVSGDLYINLKGREPQGIVEPGKEYDECIRTIAHDLKNMKLRDGSSPVEKVHIGKELYPGSVGAPDIFIEWSKGFDLIKEGEPEGFLSRLRARAGNKWCGTHSENGILILSGAGIRQGGLSQAAIEDVAPTIYHLLGLPVPSTLDGRVLSTAFTDEALRSLQYTDSDVSERTASEGTFSERETKTVAEALKNLGYLE